MSEKKEELIVAKPAKLALQAINKPQGENGEVSIGYEMMDPSHYVFKYDYSDSIKIDYVEADKKTDTTDFVDVEFEVEFEDDYKQYVIVAASCGLLTGILSVVHIDKDLEGDKSKYDADVIHGYLVIAAKALGYKKNDYKGAIEYLISKGIFVAKEVIPDEKLDEINGFIQELSSHPSICGLLFCIMAQFSGSIYHISSDGKIIEKRVPEYYAIGRNLCEKLIYGVLYWAFNMVADTVLSKRDILNSVNIPEEIKKLIKTLSKFGFVDDIPHDIRGIEKKYSEWIKKIFEKTESDDNSKFDIGDAIENVLGEVASQSFPVILNECITRAAYVLIRLKNQLSEKNISDIGGFSEINVKELIPENNRITSLMSVVSSGSFVAANTGGAVLKAIYQSKVKGRTFSEVLLAEVNFVGIGRFVFACASDSKYWADNIKIALKKLFKGKQAEYFNGDIFESEAFESLTLDGLQAQILYSLESLAIAADIDASKDKDVDLKREWYEAWKEKILKGVDADSKEYLIADEDKLYDGIYYLGKESKNQIWLYLITIDLLLFKAYTPLGTEKDKKYSKLKFKDAYVRDTYIRKQTVVSYQEAERIVKEYKHYKGIVSGETKGRIVTAGVTAIVTVATGGLALSFAPQIAVLLAGEAVAGLHGAALTSASLAYIGGGAIAAGGLGMAGGTAIITGGGAALGLAGSGTTSAIAIISSTPKSYWIRQFSKMLVFSKVVLKDKYKDSHSIQELYDMASREAKDWESIKKEIEEEDNDLDNEVIKNISRQLKFLEIFLKEIKKLI